MLHLPKTARPLSLPDPHNVEAFRDALQGSGRLLGMDLGTKTIGLAVCDAGWRVASAHSVLRRTKFGKDAEALRETVEKETIEGFVLGWPVNMDGSEGPRCQATRAFARNLSNVLPLPLLLWDERMTTLTAERALIEADMSRAKRAERIDAVAASVILQAALDRLRNL